MNAEATAEVNTKKKEKKKSKGGKKKKKSVRCDHAHCRAKIPLSMEGPCRCRCGMLLCTKHSHISSEMCSYDYKQEGCTQVQVSAKFPKVDFI